MSLDEKGGRSMHLLFVVVRRSAKWAMPILVTLSLVVSAMLPRKALAASYDISSIPAPSISVSGTNVSISWPTSTSLQLQNVSAKSVQGLSGIGAVTLEAQAFVPGTPVVRLKSIDEYGFGDFSLDLSQLNGTYVLPFPGTTYAVYVVAQREVHWSMNTAWSSSAGGGGGAGAQIKSANWLVTTGGQPPDWTNSQQNTILSQQRDQLAAMATGINSQNTILAQQRDHLAAIVATTQALASKDTVPPAVTLKWDKGATLTASSSYTLYVIASDNSGGPLQMRVNGGAWKAYSASVSVPLSVGYNEVVVEVKDPSGNVGSGKVGIWRR